MSEPGYVAGKAECSYVTVVRFLCIMLSQESGGGSCSGVVGVRGGAWVGR